MIKRMLFAKNIVPKAYFFSFKFTFTLYFEQRSSLTLIGLYCFIEMGNDP